MKLKSIFICGALFFACIMSAQNYQNQIVGTWLEMRVTMSLQCDGQVYKDVCVVNYKDPVSAGNEAPASTYYFYSNNRFEAAVGVLYSGSYSISGNSLTLKYKDGGNTESWTIDSINSGTMSLNSRDTYTFGQDDVDYLLSDEIVGFNKSYTQQVKKLSGKKVTVITSKFYKRK